MGNPESLIVPTDICQDAITNKKVNAVAVFLALKFSCSGKTRLKDMSLADIAKTLGKNERTVRKHIRTLIEWDWVGYNHKTGFYFIRSFLRVQELRESNWMHGARLYPFQLKNIREFMFSAVVGNILRSRRRRLGAERYRRSSSFSSNQPHPANCFPVSVRIIAKILSLSTSTTHAIKKSAIKKGYIYVLQEHTILDIPSRSARKLQEDLPGLHRYGQKYIYRKADRLSVNIQIKYLRWKKTEQRSI
jgi:DNA-binding CsgD family transcriptional regulator